MSKGIIALIVVGVLGISAVGVALAVGVWAMGVHNQAIGYETQFAAQVDANKSTYDKVWRILADKAGITEKYAGDFKAIYSDLMMNRYGAPDKRGSGGSLMLWVQEKNPDFDIALYKDLSQSVEALRTEFDMVQKKMIDIKRVHQNLRLQQPTALVLSVMGHKELELKMVTSTKTEKAFDSGKDDAPGLFQKTEPATK